MYVIQTDIQQQCPISRLGKLKFQSVKIIIKKTRYHVLFKKFGYIRLIYRSLLLLTKSNTIIVVERSVIFGRLYGKDKL